MPAERRSLRSRRPGGFASTLARLACATTLLAAGCHGPPRATSQPSLHEYGNAALVYYLNNQPFVTAEAGYREVYVLWKKQMFEGDFPALSETLRAGRIVDATWNHAPEDYLDRATIAYMVARAIDLRTGLNWHLLGLGRYAYRELIQVEVIGLFNYSAGSGYPGELGRPTGGEFAGIIGRAQAYAEEFEKESGRIELGAEPPPGEMPPEPVEPPAETPATAPTTP